MKDQSKTKQVLIQELVSLRQRIAKLEQSESVHKQVEEALRESEWKYRSLASTVDQMVLVDRNCQVLFANESYLNQFGNKIGINNEEFIDLNISRVLRENIQKVNETGEVRWAEVFGTHSKKWFLGSFTPIKESNGEVTAITVVLKDITERKRAEETLQESEEKLRLTVNTIPHVVSIWDMSLHCSYMSPSIQRMLGYTPEEAMALTLDQLVTPESMEIAMKTYQEDLEREQAADSPGHNLRILELDELHMNGSMIPVESTITFLRDAKGVPVGIIILATDISERKRAEKILRESEEKYRLLAENSNDVIWTTDTELRYTYYSPAVRKLRGLSPEEAIAKTLAETVTPASLNALFNEYKRQLPDIEKGLNPTAVMEIEQYCKDGSTVWVEISMTTMRDDRGILTGYVGVTRDISARKQTQEELKRRNILLSTQQEVSIDGILVVDENGTMISFNRRFVEIWAIPGEVLESKSDERALQWILGSLVDPDEFIARVRHLYENRTETSRDEIAFKDGRIIDRYSAPMLGADGKYYGRVWYFRDISERKRVEAELKEAKKAADVSNQSKSIFLANMSHEIRTPMNAILGFAQLMQRDPDLSEQSRERLDIINSSGEHLLALINDILEMSKIEAGRGTFVQSTFDLHSLLNSLEMMFRERTDAKKLRFLSETVGDVPRWVITDEGKLRQVLINLLGNAVKFTEEGGIALRFRAAAEKENTIQLQFEVEDTGPGMTEDEVGRLFQAFEQTGSGIKSGGTGLGLALSRGFIQIMGGSISVASMIGKGTRLRFEIPVREGKEEQAPPKEVKRRVLRLRTGQSEIRVLVADDRETNRRLLSQLLEAVGFPTREVVNGEEAVRMVHEWKPQVVLMDMTMPVMDGYEATRKIKASPNIKNTVIIAVTASAFEDDKQRVYAAGADGYLAKPFKDADLLESIGRLTGAEYLYEEADGSEKASETADDETLIRKSVAALPTDLVGQLIHSVERADLDQLNDLVGTLLTDHPTLAKRMREMATRYEYEALIELLSSGA